MKNTYRNRDLTPSDTHINAYIRTQLQEEDYRKANIDPTRKIF
jgi:hypothetical protein